MNTEGTKKVETNDATASGLKRLLFAIEEGKTVKIWNGNESGVLWERIFKKDNGQYLSIHFCSGFFGNNKTVFKTVDDFEKRLSEYVDKFSHRISK